LRLVRATRDTDSAETDARLGRPGSRENRHDTSPSDTGDAVALSGDDHGSRVSHHREGPDERRTERGDSQCDGDIDRGSKPAEEPAWYTTRRRSLVQPGLVDPLEGDEF
jgi:hypothetical protein